jgi:type IV secretion system protein TrbL
MEMSGLTTTLTRFVGVFQGGYSHLQPTINGVLGALAAIDIVLFAFYMAIGGNDNLAAVLKKVLFLGFWLWFTTEFQTNASAFMHSLVKVGGIAGNNPAAESLLLDPSKIAGLGLQATEPLAKTLQGISLNVGAVFVYGLSYIIIMLAFVVMAIQVFLAVLEYYLLVTVVGVLVPFGVFGPTKFLAEKAIGAVVGAGIKLMVLALLLSTLDPLFSQVRFSGPEITMNELWAILASTLTYAYLVWHVPGTIAGALAGSPSLSAASVAQNASGALMATAGLAGVGVAATRVAASGAMGAAQLGASALGTAAGGAEGAASSAARSGGTAGPAARLLGAGRALGQAALGAVGSAARRVTAPVADSFRDGARNALNRSDTASAQADAASPPPASPLAGGPSSSPSPDGAEAPPPAWASRAKSDLRKPGPGRPPATPRS